MMQLFDIFIPKQMGTIILINPYDLEDNGNLPCEEVRLLIVENKEVTRNFTEEYLF